MHLYRAPHAQHIEIVLKELKAFLDEQGCTPGFIVDLSIILLSKGTEKVWMKEHPIVGPTVLLSVGADTLEEQLDQELMRRIAIERSKSPWARRRSQACPTHHFFSFSNQLQPISVTVHF